MDGALIIILSFGVIATVALTSSASAEWRRFGFWTSNDEQFGAIAWTFGRCQESQGPGSIVELGRSWANCSPAQRGARWDSRPRRPGRKDITNRLKPRRRLCCSFTEWCESWKWARARSLRACARPKRARSKRFMCRVSGKQINVSGRTHQQRSTCATTAVLSN